jgi:lipopolysaccharide transport system permease protein
MREVKGKYKQAFFGVAWAIVQPIALIGMMTVVFSYFVRIPSDGIPYPLFLFAAMLPWNFFAGAVLRGTSSLLNQAALITKIYFPRETLVIASFVAACVDFVVTSLVFVALMFIYHVTPGVTVLFVIPALLIQVAFSLGLMLLLAPLNTMYRDVGQAMPVLLQVWMYATPLMYPASLVPERFRSIYFLNPMAVLTETYRDALLRNAVPSLGWLLYAALAAIATLVFGYVVFKRLEKRMADVA